jgi:2,4-dienoyl-CoA reductase-like NADH-dependent reductase (Old Yellow Enzyme family)
MTSALFTPLSLRSITLPNRIGVSPMCQYSSQDGFANDWHLVHLGSRAVGGAGLVMVEASAVTPEGRITPADMGIWKDEHVPNLARIVRFVHDQGSCAGIQIAHAGRKASMSPPFHGERLLSPAEGGWTTVAPSAIPFSERYSTPEALDKRAIDAVIEAFVGAAGRAEAAGFDLLEIHAAHGYLLHEFLSPLSNQRDDDYGGSFDNRVRLLLEVAAAVRRAWPEHLPLSVRISATDWVEGGWSIDDSVQLARLLRNLGVDIIDCSSGGNVSSVKIPLAPGYQVPFAARIRKEAGIATAAVGLITEPMQADRIIAEGEADMVLLAREMLRDPYFAVHAAAAMNEPATWPEQYLRAAPPLSPPRTAIARMTEVAS